MFSFFKKKPPAADAAAPVVAPPAVEPAPEPEKRSWLDRLRGAPADSAPPTEPRLEAAPTPAAAPEPEPRAAEPAPEPSPVEDSPPRRGWMDKLRGGLRKTGASIAQVFTGTQIDDALYEELESALLMADAGVKATEFLLEDLKRRVKAAKAGDPAAVKELLIDSIAELLAPLERALQVGEHVPTVIMVVGVNGAGKTTSIGKLTRHLAEAQQKVLLAAADTFRAAAREQLAVWAGRNRVEIVGQEGGDPAAVTFDAVVAGKARGCDVVIADTAGRLTTQLHLMDELKKIKRVIAKAQAGAPHEVLLVVDGNTGQNALNQVQAFDAALGLTGLVITKLDGTAKGGVLAAIALWSRERAGSANANAGAAALPVYFIGVGEKLEDLQTFSAREFAQALLT
jgi:fused signal recognition particle receptor